MSDYSNILNESIESLFQEMDALSNKKTSMEDASSIKDAKPPVKEDNSYIQQLANNISEINDRGFHYHNKQTVDSSVDLTDRYISAIKRDESIEEISPLDDYTEKRFAALSRQIMSVSNTVNTISENTLVSGIGHGPFGQAPGGGAARIIDQDDVEIDSDTIQPGQVLVWDGQAWVPQSVSGVGGDVTSIIEGDGIDVSATIAGGKGDVTISLDAVLDDLKDVTIGTEASGQVIKYTGAGYENSYLKTEELDLTNPTRIVDLAKNLNRNITVPPNLKTQLDANQFFVAAIDSLDDQIVDINVEIGDIQQDITDIKADVNTNAGDISSLSAALDNKPDMTVSDTAPSPVPTKNGQFWYDNVNDTLYISDSGNWVEITGGGAAAGGAGVTVSDTEPTTDVKEGDLWIHETDLYLYVYHGGSWIQAAYTPEYTLEGKDGATPGIVTIVLKDENDNEQELDVKGEGGIVASYSGNQIIIDGSAISSSKNFLGYISAVNDDESSLTQSPNDGDYYEFNEAGDWLGTTTVSVGDELHWDDTNSAWEVIFLPSPNLDQVLKSGNQSEEDAEIKNLILNGDNNGDGEILFPGGGSEYVKLRAEYDSSQATIGRTRLYMDSYGSSGEVNHLLLSDRNIGLTTLTGSRLAMRSSPTSQLNILDLTDDGLLYNGEKIDTHGHTDINDLADVQTSTPRQVHGYTQVVYDDDDLTQFGSYKIDSRNNIIYYGKDDNGNYNEDLYNATTVNDTNHYITNKPGAYQEFGTSSLVTQKIELPLNNGDTAYGFKYQDKDFVTTAFEAHNVGIIDPAQDGDVLTYNANDGLWHAKQPKQTDGLSGAHEINDLHDVETFDETYQVVLNGGNDLNTDGGVAVNANEKKLSINYRDNNGDIYNDVYDNTTAGSTIHYFNDNNSPAAGVGRVTNKEVDGDGNYVFYYEFVGFVQNIGTIEDAFEFGIADFSNLHNGQALLWDAGAQMWKNGDVAGGGASVIVSDTAPNNPAEGDLWYDTVNSVLFIYVEDPVDPLNNDWKPAGSSGGDTLLSDNAPADAPDGTLWFSTDTGELFVRITDSDSSQWVSTNIPAASPEITALEARIVDLENKNSNSIRIALAPPSTDLVQGNVWIDENTYNAYVWTGVEWIQLTTSIA